MGGFYHNINKEKSYHRGIFLAATVGLAGLCSVYPLACFKKFSGREQAKVDQELADLERQQREDNEWERTHHPRRSRRQSYSPPRSSRRPRQERRHSSAKPERQPRRESRSHRHPKDEDDR
jgi:hypothetical protein